MWNPFRRPEPKPSITDAARIMGHRAAAKRRAPIRAKCDEMRAQMGLPAVEWPN